MTFALSTLAVLALLWFATTLGLAMLDESGGKILAALRGQSLPALAPATQPISWRVRTPVQARQAMRAQPTLRVAA